MKTAAGLWIDHKKAVIVIATDNGDEVKIIVSNIDKQAGRTGGIKSTARYESQLVPSDDQRERHLRGQLNTYYDAVITCLETSGTLLIFGPGEAKGELKKRILKNKCALQIGRVETVDKMTDRQVLAKARSYFKECAL
jgi:hypothetical protein